MNIRVKHKNAKKIIWKLMNADKTIHSIKSLIIVLLKKRITSRKKSLRMVQLLLKWLSSLISLHIRRDSIIELKMLSNSMDNILSKSLDGKRM
jgi:hypothetical protein